jgi:amino acid transporter
MSKAKVLEAEPMVKALGLKEIWAIGVGSVVGDGIFLLMGEGGQIAGPFALVAYSVAGFLLLCMMVAMGEMAVGMPNAGSMWIWTRRCIGDLAGMISGISYAAGWIIAGGSVGIAIGTISNWFYQFGSKPETSIIIWSLIWVTVFAIVNYMGVVMASRVQLFLVLGLVGLMLLFGIVSFVTGKVDVDNYQPFMPFGAGSFFPALAYGTYAYMGALTLTTAGSEAKKPVDLPKGLVYASITFLVIYTIAMAAMFGILSYEEMSVSESPFTAAAQLAFGPGAAFVINIAAWLAAATCLLGGTLYSAPRILLSMGESRILPEVFARLNDKRVPGFATIFAWVLSVVLVLIGMKNPDVVYVTLSLLLVFCWVTTWTLGMISSIRYRKLFREEVEKLPWKQPLFPLFPIIGFFGVVIIMYGTFKGAESALITGVVFLLLQVVYYYAYGKKNIKKTETHTEFNVEG